VICQKGKERERGRERERVNTTFSERKILVVVSFQIVTCSHLLRYSTWKCHYICYVYICSELLGCSLLFLSEI